MNNRVLVSGTSGLIGTALVRSLTASGRSIVCLRHSPSFKNKSGGTYWEPGKPISPEQVSGFGAVIHLAGEGIFGRWTVRKKEKIFQSRIEGTWHLAHSIARAQAKPTVFICASAIGYYGDRGEEQLFEESKPGSGFLASVCQKWEDAASPVVQAGIRTVYLRTGIVLSRDGGALGAMVKPFALGLGGRLGDGRQWMSWIHIDDMVGAIQHIIANEGLSGAVNMVAPNPVTNSQFTKTLASVLSRPAIFPLPEFAVRAIFGQMGEELLLSSQKVEAGKLKWSGYDFKYSELRPALQSLFAR